MTRKKNQLFVAPLSTRDLRAEAERLLRERRMPTIEEFTAVLEPREKYSTKIDGRVANPRPYLQNPIEETR